MSASPPPSLRAERPALTKELEKLIEPPGFTGKRPEARAAGIRAVDGVAAARAGLVVEVRYDQVTGRRFRHGTGFLRWRPDKDPEQCTFEQLAPSSNPLSSRNCSPNEPLFDEPLIAGPQISQDGSSARTTSER